MCTEQFVTVEHEALLTISGGRISAACAAGGVVGGVLGMGFRRNWQFLASTVAGCAAGEGTRALFDRYAGAELKRRVGAAIRYINPHALSGL